MDILRNIIKKNRENFLNQIKKKIEDCPDELQQYDIIISEINKIKNIFQNDLKNLQINPILLKKQLQYQFRIYDIEVIEKIRKIFLQKDKIILYSNMRSNQNYVNVLLNEIILYFMKINNISVEDYIYINSSIEIKPYPILWDLFHCIYNNVLLVRIIIDVPYD